MKKVNFLIKLHLLLLMSNLYPSQISAQSMDPGLPPPMQEVVANRIDMMSGTLVYQQTDLSLGQIDSANYMQLDRTYRSTSDPYIGFSSFGPWEHNFKIYLIADGYIDYSVIIGQKRYSFGLSGYGTKPDGSPDYENLLYTDLGEMGNTLVKIGSHWVFTSRDGMIATFDTGMICSEEVFCFLGTKLEAANGTKVYLHYDSAGRSQQQIQYAMDVKRLKWAVNSFGYGFNFTYLSESSITGVANKSTMTVGSINGVRTTCPANPGSCTASNLSTATYQYETRTINIGNPPFSYYNLTNVNLGGKLRRYSYDTQYGGLKSVYHGTNNINPEFTVEYEASPWAITPAPGPMLTVSKMTDSSGFSTSYTWVPLSPPGTLPYGDAMYKSTNALGATTTYQTTPKVRQGRPEIWVLKEVVGSDGGVTSLEYDQHLRATKIRYPEGNSQVVSYDNRGNVLTSTLKAKPTLPAPDISQSASYPLACVLTNIRICNKPQYIVDGQGVRTNFSWSEISGGMEIQIRGLGASGNCLLPEGVCPQITQTFSPKTMPDGSTAYFLGSKSERIDATSSVTETFEYQSIRNFALNKHSIDSGSTILVTCFSHDEVGNVVSKYLPNTDLNICP